MPDVARRPLVAANWKMHKTIAEAEEFCDRVSGADATADVDVVICPPFTALAAVAGRCRDTSVRVAAQNMHAAPEGAFTGEVSAAMVLAAGA